MARAAGEVVLAAGAISSPQLLELSGIGDGRAADGAGRRRCAHDLPGVGENLQDHLQLRPIYKVSGVRDAERPLRHPAAHAR